MDVFLRLRGKIIIRVILAGATDKIVGWFGLESAPS